MAAPKQGDIIFIDAEPHSGREEGGHDSINGNIQRPEVVISSNAYNPKTGLTISMPITSKNRNNKILYLPFVDVKSGIKGSIITWQMRNFDFVSRHGKIVGHVSPAVLDELLKRAFEIFSKR